jgi:hypothetical protein
MGFAVSLAIAVLAGFLIIRVGFGMLRSFAAPMPAPPPPGELRKVKLTYVCPQCGMQLRVTQAPDQAILAPRHCMDEMDLVPEPD